MITAEDMQERFSQQRDAVLRHFYNGRYLNPTPLKREHISSLTAGIKDYINLRNYFQPTLQDIRSLEDPAFIDNCADTIALDFTQSTISEVHRIFEQAGHFKQKPLC